jgi:small subunit ribosomal protein S16
MAVKIRLKRIGAKKSPFYRVVVSDARSPRDGRFIEEIGNYDPMSKKFVVDGDKALSWIKNGAQPTETVRSLLKKNGVLK